MRKQKKNSRNYGMTGEDKDGKDKKAELALEVIERLREEYPDAECTLDYDQAWKLLIGGKTGGTVYR